MSYRVPERDYVFTIELHRTRIRTFEVNKGLPVNRITELLNGFKRVMSLGRAVGSSTLLDAINRKTSSNRDRSFLNVAKFKIDKDYNINIRALLESSGDFFNDATISHNSCTILELKYDACGNFTSNAVEVEEVKHPKFDEIMELLTKEEVVLLQHRINQVTELI